MFQIIPNTINLGSNYLKEHGLGLSMGRYIPLVTHMSPINFHPVLGKIFYSEKPRPTHTGKSPDQLKTKITMRDHLILQVQFTDIETDPER